MEAKTQELNEVLRKQVQATDRLLKLEKIKSKRAMKRKVCFFTFPFGATIAFGYVRNILTVMFVAGRCPRGC
jgi:hypothetical protein